MRELSSKEKYDLEKAYKLEKEVKRSKRLLAIICIYIEKMSVEQTSKLLRMHISTIYEYQKTYEQGQIEGLSRIEFSSGRPSKLDQEQVKALEEELSKCTHATAKQVSESIAEIFKLEYSVSGTTKLLKRLGYSYKKLKGVPAKACKKAQETFIKEVLNPIKETLTNKHILCYSDAVHMVHNSEPSYAWVKKGNHKNIPQNTGRKTIHINGIYCVNNHSVFYKEEKTVNAESMVSILTKLRNAYPVDTKITLVLDNARYNHAKYVKNYAKANNITLKFLPPYSPNLNVIERKWLLLKKEVTRNRYFEHFKDFQLAIQQFFQNANDHSHILHQKLRSLLTLNFNLLDT